MKLIIDLPEDIYNEILAYKKGDFIMLTNSQCSKLDKALRNGIPLPEHHGDLVDRDAIEVLRIGNIKREYDKGFDAGVTCMVNRILDAPTIIEGSEGE